METSFSYQNTLQLSQVRNPIIGRIFGWESRSLVLQMFSKSGHNYLIKSTYLLRFQWWYIHPDQWTIEGDMTILWSITKLGKSVHRVIRDGSFALSGTSYKGLSQCGIHPSSGAHHLFLKDKFHSDKLVSHWQQLVCPISPHLPNVFQSSLISLESYFQGESNAVCCKGQGLLLMENVGNYRNCATQIILELFGVYPIRTYPFWTFPFTLGVFFSHSSSMEVIFGVDFRPKHGFHS